MASSLERPIRIIYYVCINPDKRWDEIVLSQLNEVYNSGILESAILYIEVCCELEEYVKVIETFINDYFIDKRNCMYFLTTLTENNYEYQGINKLYNEALNNPDKVFIYFHSKGMFYNREIIHRGVRINSNPHDPVSGENKILTKYTFNKWREILGFFLEDNSELNKAAVLPSIDGYCWYNFFWASGKYLNTCEKPVIYKKDKQNEGPIITFPQGRFYYETWLGTGDNSNGYVYNLFKDDYYGVGQDRAYNDLHDIIISEINFN